MGSIDPPRKTPSPCIASDPQPTSIVAAERHEDSRLATLIDDVESSAEELFERLENQFNAVLARLVCLEEATCLDEELAPTRKEKFYGKCLVIKNSVSVQHGVPNAHSDGEYEDSDAYSDDEYGVWDEDKEAKMRRREEHHHAKLAKEAAYGGRWQQKLVAVTAQLQEIVSRTEKNLQENLPSYNNDPENWEKQIEVLVDHLTKAATIVDHWQLLISEAEKQRDHWKEVVEGYVEQRKEEDYGINLLKQEVRKLKESNAMLRETCDELANDFDEMEKAMLEEMGKKETIDRRAKASIELWEKRAIEMRDERDDLTEILQGYVEQRNESEHRIRILTQQVGGLQTQKAKLEDKVEELQGLLYSSELENETLTRMYNLIAANSVQQGKVMEEAVQRTCKLEQKINPLEEHLAESERQNALLKTQAEESESRNLSATEYICKLHEKISDSDKVYFEEMEPYRKRNILSAARITELEQQVHDRDDQIKSLAESVEQIKNQKGDLKNEVSELKHRIAFLEKELADEDAVYMEECARLASELDKATKSVEVWQGRATMMQIENTDLAELVERRAEASRHMERIEQRREGLEQRREGLEDENCELREIFAIL